MRGLRWQSAGLERSGTAAAGRSPTGAGGRRACLQSVEQRLRVGETRGEDLTGDLEQLEHARIADAVVDTRSRPSALHKALAPERAEVLRGSARIQPQRLLQVTDRPLTFAQQLQDAHPRGVAENAEEVALEHVDRVVVGPQLSQPQRRGERRILVTVDEAEAGTAAAAAFRSFAFLEVMSYRRLR